MPTTEPQAEKPRDGKTNAERPSPIGEQHTKKSNAEAPHAKKPCAKPRTEEPQASMPVKILKQLTNEMPELLPYLLLSTQYVSKVVNTPEAKCKKTKKKPSTVPQKPKTKAKDKLKVEDKKPSVEQADKPLDLTLIDGALFIRLAKSKKIKA